jgi:hypothetical protein
LKIYILPVDKSLQECATHIRHPDHNNDYGLEQDFLNYLLQNKQFLTEKVDEADFHYLPVFWWRWLCNHRWSYCREFYDKVNKAILDEAKTFTVVHVSQRQFTVQIGKKIIFLTSRSGDDVLDLPLICKAHQLPQKMPEHKYLVSFVGRLDTHPIREEMVRSLEKISNFYFYLGNNGTDFYVEKILESLITLCPRGWGGSSYRFYETMQLGRVPILLGDYDTRPFKKYIQWDKCSFYAATPEQALEIVQNCRKEELEAMGREGAQIWREKLNFGKWCQYVIKELIDLKKSDIQSWLGRNIEAEKECYE